MKAKINKIIALYLSLFILSSTLNVCFAENTEPTISYERYTGVVTMKGYTSLPESSVSIEILYPGKTNDDLLIFNPVSSINDTTGYVRYFSESRSDKKGYWEKSFTFGGDSGVYPIRIYLSDENKIYNEELDFISVEQIMRLIAQINENPLKTEEIIEKNMNIFRFESKAYNALKNEKADISGAYNELAEKTPFENIETLEKLFNETMLISAFNNIKGNALLTELAEANANELDLADEIIYEEYSKLSQAEKERIINTLEKSGYEKINDIKEDFILKTMSYRIINTPEWNRVVPRVKEYIEAYQDIIPELKEIRFTSYEALSNERQYQAINEIMSMKNSISSLGEWIESFESVCSKWKTQSLPTSGKSDSLGGGGGSGSVKSGVGNVSAVIQNTTNSGTVNEVKKDDETGFKDLDNAPWAKEGIIELSKKGIISGRSEDFFDTQANITREEFIKILVLTFNLIEDKEYISDFADADEHSWYYKYVACAQSRGIAIGDGDGNFGIGRSITREEMVAMLFRTLKIAGIETASVNEDIEFKDYEDISNWAKEACTSLQKAGIISGMEDGSFAPKSNTTRAQAAVVVYKTLLNS